MFGVLCLAFIDVCCLLVFVWRLMFEVCLLLCVVRGFLFVVLCALCVVRCLSFVVRRSSLVRCVLRVA